ncbi:MAG: hypothetical protein AAF647_04730 [Pseudomonadota bacterium]
MSNTAMGVVKRIQADDALKAEFEADPMATLEREASRIIPDTRVYRMVVGFLGVAALLCLGFLGAGAFVPAVEMPDTLGIIASTIIGAMAGLLAPQPE